ncbi:hypothetical protein VOLCADRAFT_87007 [Volvox carteri f. nagariensis]|uniref:Transmembrane protein n=1 Tax=Volvox carteri f. nagariensis TaxID=3068 RepID=D8TJX7_VOLCA|nr:uncharacterized protein VOLCADRAFT_87007 [Volvox carteri f. nagariensis]EFJ52148.1 hypothetical protein VOLCADRAFT_87007 [Volvox carteri f. nagariensis]|eukprot:XP_002946922.1 hypothetical protein VOLCADRAFT_87007 [Volvox carteri f. nagariensis]
MSSISKQRKAVFVLVLLAAVAFAASWNATEAQNSQVFRAGKIAHLGPQLSVGRPTRPPKGALPLRSPILAALKGQLRSASSLLANSNHEAPPPDESSPQYSQEIYPPETEDDASVKRPQHASPMTGSSGRGPILYNGLAYHIGGTSPATMLASAAVGIACMMLLVAGS